MLLGADEVGRQRVAEQVGDGHLRLAVLDRPPDLAQRVAGEDAHQDGAGGLAAAGAADEQALAPRREGQQRQQHEARVALARGQGEAALGVAEHERLRRAVVVLDVVVRADDRVVDDPEVGLAQLLVEGLAAVGSAIFLLGNRTPIEIGYVEGMRDGRWMWICGRLRDALEKVESSHAPMKIKEAEPAFNAKDRRQVIWFTSSWTPAFEDGKPNGGRGGNGRWAWGHCVGTGIAAGGPGSRLYAGYMAGIWRVYGLYMVYWVLWVFSQFRSCALALCPPRLHRGNSRGLSRSSPANT